MRIVIIEDEFYSAERLQKMILDITPNSQILIILDSIKSSINWFKQNLEYDLVFMDIQLADGISFSIFDSVQISKPIIFTTAYDEYALKAFKVNSIDYLLKPIAEADLKKSFDKLKKLTQNTDVSKLVKYFKLSQNEYKQRFLVHNGSVMLPIKTDKIAFFYIHNQLTLLLTNKGNKYMIDNTLDEIENLINPVQFFRINRQMIISIGCIKKIEPFFSNRLILFTHPDFFEDVIVSKRKVSSFKKWIG